MLRVCQWLHLTKAYKYNHQNPSPKWITKLKSKSNHWMQPLIDYNKTKPVNVAYPMHWVTLIKPSYHIPYWEKDVISELGFTNRIKSLPILNSQMNNEKLSKIKHLVLIEQLKFKENDINEINNVNLKDFYIDINSATIKRRKYWKPKMNNEESTEKSKQYNENWNLSYKLLDKTVKRDQKRFMIHYEYVEPQYEYLYNQDGKEYRYDHERQNQVPSAWIPFHSFKPKS
ncbi:hypothetical protein A3Q56_03688 [Intoshia linei]|uniref:39S ribosomal protein L30, mitochondrial n=1 Tax=Intoshia linei TaxID=1819745 RepID=A0A177B4R5_9BILA|nr:hypothetical protein A3Q56_03688 [Intoshia linei]